MTRGYLVLAQQSGDNDYIRHAYALALSIKKTQSTVKNISLITDTDPKTLDPKIVAAFDQVLPILWSDRARTSEWKIENKWKYYYSSPYDETIILDADMVFPKDISIWWDVMSKQDVWITNKPCTYRNEIITSTKYRDVFVNNSLPNVYTAFMYFKKNTFVDELFRMVNYVFTDWEKFYGDFLISDGRPDRLSGDVAYALAIKILGIEDQCFGHSNILPSFVHMKGHLQGVDEKFINEDWTTNLPTYFRNDGSFKIGNYEQTLPFHYHVKSWLTDEIIKKLEE